MMAGLLWDVDKHVVRKIGAEINIVVIVYSFGLLVPEPPQKVPTTQRY